MAILTQDIKLLKSAVMADTTDGGGPMTGNVVVDGADNNLFPDTSTTDRAQGRVNLRQVFGVAHTSDTDTLLGAYAMITQPPADPLVHCALLQVSDRGVRRDVARDAIEKYLVKGPRTGPQLYDAHYAGSLQIRLITFVDAPFPASGDAIVLRSPSGQEQFVRPTKVVLSTQQVAIFENSTIQVLTATIATMDIAQALAYDFIGSPASRIVGSGYAQVYSTNAATGAKFYGIKKLGVAASIGDLSAQVDGGIFTPIVPAATIESAIVGQFPLSPVSQLNFTSTTSVTLDSSLVTLAPNRTLNFPTAIRPGSVSVVAAGLTFTDDSQGKLMQSGATVGAVDYKLGVVTFASTAPYNTTVNAAASYVPASLVLATNNSLSMTITSANQGLSFTNVFEPAPSPGSFSLSYMAQGRWYELTDNANGKLSGADNSYGIGTVNYTTGSMSVTLGAVPDVGSELLAVWGSKDAAVQPLPAALPTKASVSIPVLAGASTADMTLAWENGATPYTATLGSNGLLTGAATGSLVNGNIIFEPDVFPTGNILLNYKRGQTGVVPTFTGQAGLYQITSALPVTPGTLRFSIPVVSPTNAVSPVSTLDVFDFGGRLFSVVPGNLRQDIGSVDYATGAIALNASLSTVLLVTETVTVAGSNTWLVGGMGGNTGGGTFFGTPPSPYSYTVQVLRGHIFALDGLMIGLTYSQGVAVSATPITFTPSAWIARVNSPGAELGTASLSFSVGNQKYSVKDGSVVQNWSFGTAGGGALVAGTVSGSGLISINAANLPINRVNTVVFGNVAVNRDPGKVSSGVFRILSAPIKIGIFQLQSGALVGTATDAGIISGGGFTGTVDFQRGIVRWVNTAFLDPAAISYNAVLLQYLPLDGTLLGLNTERLPLDGKVPIFRPTTLAVVHNTQTYALPSALVKGTTYSLGRGRIARVRVKDALNVLVPEALYTSDLDLGTLTVPPASNITAYTQPLSVAHTIADVMTVTEADISGRLKFSARLTHAYPANTSYVSSAIRFSDLFGRVFNVYDQQTWTEAWSDSLIGNGTLASYNTIDYPPTTTNRGAVTERWALIFTSNTAFRIVGESYGQVGTGTINTVTEPVNTATGAPFFSLAVLGWGGGWSAGNVMRLNTEACGAPFWVSRTILQGPNSLASDKFVIEFNGDVNA